MNALAVEKDVDGITDLSMASVFMGRGAGAPAPPAPVCAFSWDYHAVLTNRGRRLQIKVSGA